MYTDSEKLPDKLDKYVPAAPAEEDNLIHAAAVLEDFGITITGTREEFEEAVYRVLRFGRVDRRAKVGLFA